MQNRIPLYDETDPVEYIPQYNETEPVDIEQKMPVQQQVQQPIVSAPVEITPEDKPLPLLPEKLSEIVGQPIKQNIEDTLRMGLQGLTFSTSDEIMAALRALADTTGGRFKDLYEKYKGIEARELERIRKESPVQSLAAEIVGGIPSGGALGSALKAANIIKGVKSAPLLTKLKEAAILGGTGAALENIGKQEEGVSVPEALQAGALGAAVSDLPILTGSAGKKLMGQFKESYTGKAFERAAKEGKKSVGKEALEAASKDVEVVGEDLAKTIKKAQERISEIYRKAYDPKIQYDADAFRAVINRNLNAVQRELGDLAQFKRLESELIGSKHGVINPNKMDLPGPNLQKLEEVLEKYAYKGNYDPTIKELAKNILSQFDEVKRAELEKIAPGLADEIKKADSLWTEFSKIGEIPGFGTLKEISPEHQAQTVDSIIQKLKSSVEGETAATGTRKREIERLMGYAGKIAPEEMAELSPKIKSSIEDYGFVKELSREPEATPGARLGTILYRASPYLGEKAGFAAKSIRETIAPAKQTVSSLTSKLPKPKISDETKTVQLGRATAALSRRTSNMTEEELRANVDKLKANPQTARLGEALEKALNEGDSIQRNAILNKILQIPEGREVLKE